MGCPVKITMSSGVEELAEFAQKSSSSNEPRKKQVADALQMVLSINENLDVDSFETACDQFLSTVEENPMNRNAIALVKEVCVELRKKVGDGDKDENDSEQDEEKFEPTMEGLPISVIIKIAGYLDSDEDWTPFCGTSRYLCFCVNLHIQYIALVMRLVKFLILGQLDVSDELLPEDAVEEGGDKPHAAESSGYPQE